MNTNTTNLGPYFGELPKDVISIILSKIPLQDRRIIEMVCRYFSQMDLSTEARLRCENFSFADLTFLNANKGLLNMFFSDHVRLGLFTLIVKGYLTYSLAMWQAPDSTNTDVITLITYFKNFIQAYNHFLATKTSPFHVHSQIPSLNEEAQSVAHAWKARLQLPNDQWMQTPQSCVEIFTNALEQQNPLHLAYRAITQWYESKEVGIQQLSELASNCALAQYTLAEAYLNGLGVEKSDKQAIKWLTQAADNDDLHAQYILGQKYQFGGQGTEKNLLQAKHLFLRAALQNHREARTALGFMYASGLGVDKNMQLALLWFLAAAKQNEKVAQHNLGNIYFVGYFDGKDIKQDDAKAVHFFWHSAVQGHAPAQFNLGCLYEMGRGIEKNDKEARRWYRLATLAGESRATESLAAMHCHRGVEMGAVEDFNLLKGLVENNKASVQYALGLMYGYGCGIQKNLAEAAKYYKLAADQNHVNAQIRLGWLHFKGEGVEKDERAAAELFRAGASQGNKRAQSNLAFMYANGYGVEESIPNAITWFRQAAKQGCVLSHLCLGILLPSKQEADLFFEEGRKKIDEKNLAILKSDSSKLIKQIRTKLEII